MAERGGFGFTNNDKYFVRDRADGDCEFPGELCPEPNTGKVNHITGCFIARLEHIPKSTVSDPYLNAVMLCPTHEFDLDVQEFYQQECILFERH